MRTSKNMLGAFAGLLLTSLGAQADDKAVSLKKSAHDFSFDMPYGEPLSLSEFSGKLVLLVNTATACGFTNQLAGLQQLNERYSEKGLVVLGVPSNDFGNQEPRDDDEIAGFCKVNYGVTFTMTSKTGVKGAAAHPFYKWARKELGALASPYWNFHKYLIGPNGELVAWYASPTKPTSRRIVNEIEKRLSGTAS